MHIKEICLEGFKSYATRTVVPDFDPHFNAITGLNGSGKSNILDSICFVLGITNLSQVRATNLQELVYKSGQAGITKATVSVVFDNSDRSGSPLGYEGFQEITVTRQIIIGGRNKYLINGHLAQPSRVQTLFHSVQLNVNNPHFLIMQGRITKVLNMKPPEILSMLEEAAGTRMYETKKETALKTLEKKQSKVDEIDKLLNEEILPALEKLRKERGQYMQWSSGNANLERLKRFCIAYEFAQSEKMRDERIVEIEEIKNKMSELDDGTGRLKAEIVGIETKINALILDKEAKIGGEMKALAQNVDDLSCSLVKESSILDNNEDSLLSEKKTIEEVIKSIEDIKMSISEQDASVKRADDGASDLKKRVEELSKNLDMLNKDYQGVLAGKSSGNDDKSLQDQLFDARAAVGDAETDLDHVKTKLIHSANELKEKKQQLLSKCEEADAVFNELNARTNDIEKIKLAMESLMYKDGQMEALEKEHSNEKEIVLKLKDEVRIFLGQLANAQFTYQDPVRNFDRSKVKGLIANLIHVKDSSTMTALEVAAGGKLYNVVTDTENTGKQLLQNGELRKRVTIIPLNKIHSNTVSLRVQQAATRQVGEGNAQLALSLIGYDEEVKNAMDFVFGSTFVCRDINSAKEVAFNKDTCTRSVTLEGDVFQPSGILTGGSRRGGGELLRKLHALSESESNLIFHQKKLSDIENKIALLLPCHKRFVDLNSQLELESYDLALFQKRAEQNEQNKLAELVRKIEHEVEEMTLVIKEKQVFYATTVSTVSSLEKTIKEHGTQRESKLSDLDREIKAVNAEMKSAMKHLKVHGNEKQRLIMEKEAVLKELVSLENQLTSLQIQINTTTNQAQEQKRKVCLIKENFKKAESELNIGRSKLRECDVQISAITKELQKLQHRQSDDNVARKKMENEARRMEIEQKDVSSRVDKLLEKHSWILTEKQLFGKGRTEYDFSSRDPHKAMKEYEHLKAEQSGLEKRVNKKVMAMFEKAEDEYNSLMSKKNVIENDKMKIKMVIEELDEKKKETLKMTWVKVNKDFGSIFSTLLPGTMGKLEPPEGCNFLDGLEVRVAFGSVWKQSLSELSGGQRSLLALSLILALLLYKPAPLYILDEVDAALDLSHTQNIGRMIKTHFPHSQFIVVSLKEGMFNNANVLFRTKFVDGVSTVQRTVAAKE